MEKKRSAGVILFGLIGILLCLFYLIFVGLSIRLGIRSFQLKWLLAHFWLTATIGICLGVCAIFVLKLKNWARIIYLISLVTLPLILWRDINFLNTMGLFAYDLSLSNELWNFSELIVFSLGPVNIFLFVAALIFFTRPRVKEQFR